MARLPRPGGDEDNWAELLNEFLSVAHNADGTPRKTSLAALSATVGLNDLRVLNPASQPLRNLLLSNDGTNLVWKQTVEVNVRNYGAVGDGITDDTDAIQAAINDTTDGGAVWFPRGVFMVRTLKVVNKGTSLIGNGRWATRILRINGSTDPVIDMSGTGTGLGHTRYNSIQELTVSGNGLSGPLLRGYYADNCIFREVSFIHCPGMAIDFSEVWDSRFENCSWENCGSVNEPAVLLRNSTPPGTFGFSNDNTNQVHFTGCRWEGFRNGAVRLDGTMGNSTSLLNGIFFVACKMETSLAAGPALQIMPGTTIIFVKQLYIALLMTVAGYNDGPIDAIVDYGSQVVMSSLYVQWGDAPGLANATIHALRGGPHIYSETSAYYPTEPPATATIVAETGTDVLASNLWFNRGQAILGDVGSPIKNDPNLGAALSIKNSGSFRIKSAATNRDLFKVDNSSTRPTVHTVNGADLAGFSGDYSGEKWRFYGDTGFVRLASGNFQIEGTKGYIGIGTAPFTGIGFLIKLASDTDRGLTIMRKSGTSTGRMMEFQDESHNIVGQAFDANGRPTAVGPPPHVSPGDQTSYANPRTRVQDMAGNITAAVKAGTTQAGIIATVTFSRPFTAPPLSIVLNDQSAVSSGLYVSASSEAGFTISTRQALRAGSILNFDYTVSA